MRFALQTRLPTTIRKPRLKTMKVRELDINLLLENNIDLKEKNVRVEKKLSESLLKFGQIYPVIVNAGTYNIVKGMSLVRAMKKIGFKTAFVNEVEVNNSIELLTFKKLLYDSCDDINILSLASVITELNKTNDINKIHQITKIHIKELINMVDLLKLDNLIKEKNNNKQQTLFI